MNFLTKKISTCLRGKYYSYEGRNIQNYPIIEISEEEQEPFIELAKYMLDLNEKLTISNNASEKQLIEQEILTTDKKIDQLVYDLYNISNDEIKDIEKYLELFKK